MCSSDLVVGQPSPILDITGLQSEQVMIGGPQAKSTLLFFLSPTCPVCKKLIPILKHVSRDESAQLRVVLASDGEGDHLQFMREQGLQSMPYVLFTELGMSYRVSRLPYAVLLDREGLVRAKGLVNSREQLDSLLNAQDMDTPTIQKYLEEKTA